MSKRFVSKPFWKIYFGSKDIFIVANTVEEAIERFEQLTKLNKEMKHTKTDDIDSIYFQGHIIEIESDEK